jgi:hypothetical protein
MVANTVCISDVGDKDTKFFDIIKLLRKNLKDIRAKNIQCLAGKAPQTEDRWPVEKLSTLNCT